MNIRFSHLLIHGGGSYMRMFPSLLFLTENVSAAGCLCARAWEHVGTWMRGRRLRCEPLCTARFVCRSSTGCVRFAFAFLCLDKAHRPGM